MIFTDIEKISSSKFLLCQTLTSDIQLYFVGLRGPPGGGPLCYQMEPSSNDASLKKAKNYVAKRARTMCTWQMCLSWFPFIQWAPKYSLEFLGCDIIAGITLALTAIPQGIGYAPLAGLPLQVFLI